MIRSVAWRAGLATLFLVILAWLFWPRDPGDDNPSSLLLRQAAEAAARGDRAAAQDLLDRALEQNPQDGQALLLLAQLALEDGDKSRALELLRRAPAAPAWIGGSAQFSIGAIERANHRFTQADAAFNAAVPLLSSPAPALKELASLRWLRMQRIQTLESLESLADQQPWTMEELVMFLLVGRIGDPVESHIQQLTSAVEVDPTDTVSAAALAHYLRHSQDPADAETAIARLVKAHPACFQCRALLAEILVANRKLTEASQVMEPVPPEKRVTPLLQRAVGVIALANGQVREAAASLQRAYLAHPDDPESNFLLSVALKRMGHPELAGAFAARAVGLQALSSDLAALQLAAQSDRTQFTSRLRRVLDRLDSLECAGKHARVVAWYEECGLKSYLGPIPDSTAELATKPNPPSLTDRLLAVIPRETKASAAPASHPDAAPSVPAIFVDVAQERDLSFRYFNGHSPEKYIVGTLGGGAAVLDFDQDEWPDLFFAQGAPFDSSPTSKYRNAFFRNHGRARFEEITTSAGLEDTAYSVGCAATDFDNDGDQDLFVANVGRDYLYENNGDGTFTEVSQRAGLNDDGISSSVLFCDVDVDGDLDIYLLNYVAQMPVCRNKQGEPVVCHPRDLAAADNVLYENLGNGIFRDVTERSGMKVSGSKSLGAVACDFNDDGRPDIYVSNDTTPNHLFRNRSSATPGSEHSLRFEEVGLAAGCALDGNGKPQAGMGIALGDLDRNGHPDIYVTNFYAEVNTLYSNEGNLIFSDRTIDSGLAEPSRAMLGFGTQAVDADLDGWLDLLVLNGHIADNRKHGEPWKMRSQFYRNSLGRFSEQRSMPGGFLEPENLGRGLTQLDFNRDGKPDLVATYLDRDVALLENQTPTTNHYIALEFCGRLSSRDAANVKVKLRADEQTWSAELWTGGYLGSNEKLLLLGIGDQPTIDELVITWPSGIVERQSKPRVDRRLLVLEPATVSN